MRVLLIGGNGAAGSRIAAEARRRDHEVTIASRTTGLSLDASDVEAVAAAAARVDLVIAATRPAIGHEAEVDAVTEALAAGTARANARLLVVGGASPLRVPGTGWTALDDPRWVPPAIRPIAVASTRQLEVLQATGRESAWTYLAPAADFAPAADLAPAAAAVPGAGVVPGIGQGSYRIHLGRGGLVPDLVIAADGTSRIAMEDFALAVLDEVEEPRMLRGVLAVGA